VLDRVIEIIRSGYTVPAEPEPPAQKKTRVAPGRELVYVSASGPVAVWVEDADGNRTGPASLEEIDRIVYGLPTLGFKPAADSLGLSPIAYEPGETGVALSLPQGSAYTVSIQTPEAADVRVSRVRVQDDDVTRRTVLFEDQTLGAGQALRFTFAPGDTPEDTPLARDADGDGTFESEMDPSVVLESTSGAPAVPLPSPSAIFTQALAGETVEVGLVFPELGGASWTWTLAEAADWIEPSATAGTTPGILTLTLSRASGSDALQSTTIDLTLSYEGYTLNVPVPVELRTGTSTAEEPEVPLPNRVSLDQNFPNPFAEGTHLSFALPQSMAVRLVVYDVLGREVAVLLDGMSPAGVHTIDVSARDLPSGVYLYRLSTPAGDFTRRLTIVR
jgi:hypothetical protein